MNCFFFKLVFKIRFDKFFVKIFFFLFFIQSGGLSIDEFQIAVQEATNFPLRPNVLPFLRSHLPILQREINSLARVSKQTPLQYVRANESSVLELLHNPTEHSDIFLSNEGSYSATNGLNLKRRATEA